MYGRRPDNTSFDPLLEDWQRLLCEFVDRTGVLVEPPAADSVVPGLVVCLAEVARHVSTPTCVVIRNAPAQQTEISPFVQRLALLQYRHDESLSIGIPYVVPSTQ